MCFWQVLLQKSPVFLNPSSCTVHPPWNQLFTTPFFSLFLPTSYCSLSTEGANYTVRYMDNLKRKKYSSESDFKISGKYYNFLIILALILPAYYFVQFLLARTLKRDQLLLGCVSINTLNSKVLCLVVPLKCVVGTGKGSKALITQRRYSAKLVCKLRLCTFHYWVSKFLQHYIHFVIAKRGVWKLSQKVPHVSQGRVLCTVTQCWTFLSSIITSDGL